MGRIRLLNSSADDGLGCDQQTAEPNSENTSARADRAKTISCSGKVPEICLISISLSEIARMPARMNRIARLARFSAWVVMVEA